MTLLQWLEAQLAQLDDPAYITGYVTGVLDGQRRALEATKRMVEGAKEKADAASGADGTD